MKKETRRVIAGVFAIFYRLAVLPSFFVGVHVAFEEEWSKASFFMILTALLTMFARENDDILDGKSSDDDRGTKAPARPPACRAIR